MFSKYVLILVWIGFMAAIQRGQQREEFDDISGEYVRRVTPLFAFIVFVPVIWISATRRHIGDTSIYLYYFHEMPVSFSDLSLYMKNINKDSGFSFVSAVIHIIIGNNDSLYLLMLALFQAVALIKLFRRYSPDYVFSVFLFIASTDYVSWMLNGTRQFTAVSVALLATPYILESNAELRIKDNIKWIMIVLIASTFHNSALLVIPIIFVAKGEPWNKNTLIFLFLIILSVSFVGTFTGVLDDALQWTQYKNVVSDYTSWNDDGTNPIRVAVYSIPAILSFFHRKKIKESNNILINFCTNMAIVSMGLYLLSMVTSGIFIGRLPIYASLYSYILLPWELDNIFGERNGMKTLACIAYLLFYYVQMHLTYGAI